MEDARSYIDPGQGRLHGQRLGVLQSSSAAGPCGQREVGGTWKNSCRTFRAADKSMEKKIMNKNTPQLAVVLVGLFVGFYMMTLPSRTQAQCIQWDARKMYGIKQSNNILVKVELIQRGPRISGNANFQGKKGIEHGTVLGYFRGDLFRIEIKWDYGETGVYVGKRIEEQTGKYRLSYLVGDAIIKEQPDNQSRRTTWKSAVSIMCLPARGN